MEVTGSNSTILEMTVDNSDQIMKRGSIRGQCSGRPHDGDCGSGGSIELW